MARGRRMSGRRRRRPETQWVTFGYNNELIMVSAGGQDAVPLTVSRNSMNVGFSGGNVNLPAVTIKTMERSLAIRGHLVVEPGESWTTSTITDLAFRIIEAPMDVVTGAVVVDVNYTLLGSTFANEPFLWQDFVYERQALEPKVQVIPLHVKVSRRIDENNALFLVGENSGNTTVHVRTYLRVLMTG